ncbi:hypothetical protein AB9P05_23440 [Roseivirga sp. BDSF3-8]|uniref:hypothetical protein n=1 Tax=Roseivirga sp. BDSF3-8 TaxID=3241598 RepID=UPI0035324C10
MRKLLTMMLLPMLVFVAACGSSEDEEPLPANEISDTEGVSIVLEWSTGGSNTQSLDDVDLDMVLMKGTTEVDESSRISSFEDVTLEPIFADGEYSVDLEYYSGSVNVSFTVYVIGINSSRTLEYTGSFSADEGGNASWPGFLTITKTGDTYSVQR